MESTVRLYGINAKHCMELTEGRMESTEGRMESTVRLYGINAKHCMELTEGRMESTIRLYGINAKHCMIAVSKAKLMIDFVIK